MICSECNKRPATLHFTQIINGEKTEVNVCETCAQNEGYFTSFEEPFSLHDLLTGLFNVTSKSSKVNLNKGHFFDQFTSLKCTHCELSFDDFQRIGKFGCAHCYEAFKPRVESVIQRVHSGNAEHNGKIPKRTGGKLQLKRKLSKHREYLKELIQAEKFEEAALVRDEIKAMEQGKGGNES